MDHITRNGAVFLLAAPITYKRAIIMAIPLPAENEYKFALLTPKFDVLKISAVVLSELNIWGVGLHQVHNIKSVSTLKNGTQIKTLIFHIDIYSQKHFGHGLPINCRGSGVTRPGRSNQKSGPQSRFVAFDNRCQWVVHPD